MRKGRFLLWGFKAPSDLLQHGLGSLEQQVIDVVWTKGAVTVRDVQAELNPPVAYTTVMTTLDRLFRKGLLTRTKASRAFRYSAVTSREELENRAAADVLTGLVSGRATEARPLLSCFVDAVGERDAELLDELDRLVKAKRRTLEKEGGK